MLYLLAFDPRMGALTRFEMFEEQAEALERRFDLERDPFMQGEEIVVIGSPDLFTLMYHHSRYFTHHDGNNGIEWCFFCRSILSFEEIDHEEVGVLERASFYEGHCLLCHQAYPLWFHNGDYAVGPLPQHGIAVHAQQCPVIADIELQQI